MKLVLTNDDGIDEPGMACLAEACSAFGEVVVVAPAGPRSAISHQVTEADPIHVEERRAGWFAVDGTPADCTRLAVRELCPDADWVLSGVNAGANLGVDVYVSGTVAAAREAAIHGVRALALSQYFRRFGQVDWAASQRRAELVLGEVLGEEHRPGEYWSANFPDPPAGQGSDEIVHCELDAGPGSIAYQRSGPHYAWAADYHERPRRPGLDVDVCFGGRIALTRLRLAG